MEQDQQEDVCRAHEGAREHYFQPRQGTGPRKGGYNMAPASK